MKLKMFQIFVFQILCLARVLSHSACFGENTKRRNCFGVYIGEHFFAASRRSEFFNRTAIKFSRIYREKLSNGNSHWDRLVHCHHYRHSWIRSRCCELFGVAIVRCNYFRPRSAAATFVADGTVAAAAAGAGSGPAAADVNWGAASGAFVDSD